MTKLIFEKHGKGKNKFRVPDFGVKDNDVIPDKFKNSSVDLPDVNEVDVVRHYTNLSSLNFGVDRAMYPLGSCTMKHNPRINEKISSLMQFSALHPMCGDTLSQGALQVIHELSVYLSAITGMSAFSLAPAAGSHGELTGVMIIKKYFEEIGEKRDKIIIPDSAHGTNPASVAMCGFKILEAPSNQEGDVDLDKLSGMIDGSVAAMMLTSPNTLGLFDRNILKISEMLHANGSVFYADGANLNAVIGTARMKDMGFDIMHINLHKTFSTPHGGGGPGSGPVGVVEKFVKYLPVPFVREEGGKYALDYNRPDSIGRVHSFYGNFLVALKSYAYIRTLGPEGIRDISRISVLNANYLRSRLMKEFNLPINRTCMHEFVLNDKDIPNHVTTNDLAKRLLDYGYHAPTVYFPLLIPGAMMIEPTETEGKDSLDEFVDAMIKIKKEASDNPEIILGAPHTTPVRRVDAVAAARNPILKWQE
ncbi:MAG: aminomethyl-transferring glycine dehydrogenase subunit GcvPB [Spirochaetes bacterium]|jgi:glycine dehydrogenase subunit 2|nr:aminomethyl-transferring glycine dehydrogenase subunit GcvPB [Spirochaetota bacterium]